MPGVFALRGKIVAVGLGAETLPRQRVGLGISLRPFDRF